MSACRLPASAPSASIRAFRGAIAPSTSSSIFSLRAARYSSANEFAIVAAVSR